MTRRFLSEGVQERFTQARFDAIRTLLRLARDEDCQFVVVCGDVFESNQVDRKTVSRALDALGEAAIPVYLLPGNHDPLTAASVYRSSTFLELKPAHVHVIEDTSPIGIDRGIEIVGAPWRSKRPDHDLVADAMAPLESVAGVTRVCVAHGIVDSLSPNPDDPALISLASVEEALSQGKIHYLALGDRHSLTELGKGNRIRYAGTPESTDYDEARPGFALIVEIDEGEVIAKEVSVGNWRFIEKKRVDLNTEEDIEALRRELDEILVKDLTIAKLRLVGTLSLMLHGRLDGLLAHARDLFGALEIREDHLVMVPEDADFTDLGFSGFASATVERLRSKIGEAGAESIAARDALSLLVRLVRSTQ